MKKGFLYTIGLFGIAGIIGAGVAFAKADPHTELFRYILTRVQHIQEEKAKLPEKPVAPKPMKGIYLTAYTILSNWGDDVIDAMIESGGNTVVIDIEHGEGLLTFRPKNELLKGWNPGSDTLNHLPEIIDQLHEKGLYVMARQVVFNDPYMGKRMPEWRIKNKWGGLYDSRWLDPSLPSVQNYNLLTLKEVAQLGFDEVQFDYIRFPTHNYYNLDYHYDETKFERSDVINDFLKKSRRVADELGVNLGVDVFGAIVWGGIDWTIVGQNVGEMAEHVDAIYPMVYPSHVSPGYYGHMNPWGAPYGFIFNSVEKFVEKAQGKEDIRIWVQGFPLKIPRFGTWFIEDQINATFDAKGTGYVIWSPGNIYTLSWPAMKIDPKMEEVVVAETEVTEVTE
ncbi:hypothetical protein KAR91_00175 [Candidatus Pacearchaeota archaeon]|nr:hypothetical protein [Candidatus Pacearchaeota archaeon]